MPRAASGERAAKDRDACSTIPHAPLRFLALISTGLLDASIPEEIKVQVVIKLSLLPTKTTQSDEPRGRKDSPLYLKLYKFVETEG